MIKIALLLLFFLSSFSCSFKNEIKEKIKNVGSNVVKELPQKKNTTLSSSLNYFQTAIVKSFVNNIHNDLPGTEVSINGTKNNKPEFQILTIKEIENSNNLKNTFFWQGSFLHHDGGNRNTVNLGLGYRRLSENNFFLTGVNAFLDQEFPYNHQRTSLGVELKNPFFELTSNHYWNISGWKTGKNNEKERAYGGYDMDIGIQVPYIPAAKLHAQTFNWKSKGNTLDKKGEKLSLNLNSPLGNGWSIETGYKLNDTEPNQKFVNLSYKWVIGEKLKRKIDPIISKVAYEKVNMLDRRLEKVRRENKIIKQVSGLTLSFR